MLVPVHGGNADFQTIDLAAAIAGRTGGVELTLVYVVEVPQELPLDADLPNEVQRGEAMLERAEDYARELGRTGERWSRVTSTLLQARLAAAAVVDEAIDRAADAIVLGTTNQMRLGILTQGETLPYVLDNAPCDVVVLRLAPGSGEVQ